jgi:hypothetical protein
MTTSATGRPAASSRSPLLLHHGQSARGRRKIAPVAVRGEGTDDRGGPGGSPRDGLFGHGPAVDSPALPGVINAAVTSSASGGDDEAVRQRRAASSSTGAREGRPKWQTPSPSQQAHGDRAGRQRRAGLGGQPRVIDWPTRSGPTIARTSSGSTSTARGAGTPFAGGALRQDAEGTGPDFQNLRVPGITSTSDRAALGHTEVRRAHLAGAEVKEGTEAGHRKWWKENSTASS